MMRAMVIHRFGPSSVFEPADLPVPEIGDDEVLIAVRASSVNPVDWKIRKGLVPALCPSFPAVLHPDCAGVVAQAGSSVSHLKEGDKVYAFASGLVGKQGALAEFMAADARMVAPMPRSLSFEEAATLPLVGVTNWLALIGRMPIKPSSTILIQGGTGGVGFLAVQLARAKFDNYIYATCGTSRKCVLAEDLGAQKAYNYKTAAPETIVKDATGGRGFDIVFNTAGADAVNDAVAMAAFGGTILDINGTFPTEGPFQFKALGFLSIFGGYPITHGFDQALVGDILSQLATLVDIGMIRPLIDPNRFTFAEAGAAHDYLETGSPTGKIALTSHWSEE